MSKVSNELYRSRKTRKIDILDIKVDTASKSSVKVRYILGHPGVYDFCQKRDLAKTDLKL